MKTRSTIHTIVSAIFGLLMVNAGLNKFFFFMDNPEMPEAGNVLMEAFIASNWIMPLVAMVEIVGGILFIFPKTRALGAITILPVIVGILLFNIVLAPANIPFGAVLFSINVWAILENRSKYLPMIQ
jgi:uncharacterized membrane protein YphA (DoxX/SURF4 family)